MFVIRARCCRPWRIPHSGFVNIIVVIEPTMEPSSLLFNYRLIVYMFVIRADALDSQEYHLVDLWLLWLILRDRDKEIERDRDRNRNRNRLINIDVDIVRDRDRDMDTYRDRYSDFHRDRDYIHRQRHNYTPYILSLSPQVWHLAVLVFPCWNTATEKESSSMSWIHTHIHKESKDAFPQFKEGITERTSRAQSGM